MDAAPLLDDIADAPAGGAAHWLTTSDGLRIRVAHWNRGARGTVLLFPGRTEYVEKYGRAAAEFAARGFAMMTLDWRGQGLADRLTGDTHSGHVDAFPDYQRDVAAMLSSARALALPEPFYLVAHSMGGAIGLRALIEGLPVRAAAFSAPMWGIVMAPALRPLAWTVSWASRNVGMSHRFAPGTSGNSYVTSTGFPDNMLTTDPGMWAYMQTQVEAHPELCLGGPSLHWLYEALTETRDLARRAAPGTPTYTAFGSDEKIVDRARIAERMADWPAGTMDQVTGARHELMMETPAIRARFFDRAAELFAAHA